MSGMAGMDHGMPMASATAGAPDHSGHAMPGTTMTGDAPKPGSPAMAGMGMTAGPPVSGLRKQGPRDCAHAADAAGGLCPGRAVRRFVDAAGPGDGPHAGDADVRQRPAKRRGCIARNQRGRDHAASWVFRSAPFILYLPRYCHLSGHKKPISRPFTTPALSAPMNG